MKIEINVLPDKQKVKIREEKKIGFALKMAFIFVAVLVLVNTVLFLMRMVLNIEYQAAKQASAVSLSRGSGKEVSWKKFFRTPMAK